MHTFRTDVNAWLRSRPHVIIGRSFPFGEYSCTPLLCDAEECEYSSKPTAFILSRGKYLEIIEPEGPHCHLWETLLTEMEQWLGSGDAAPKTPPEYWYG